MGCLHVPVSPGSAEHNGRTVRCLPTLPILLFGRGRSRHQEVIVSLLLDGDRPCDGRAAACSLGAAVGRRVSTGVLDACDQDAGRLAGGGQFALSGGLAEELMGFVAACFGVGQDGGQGLPGWVGEDAVGLIGDGGADVVGEQSASSVPRLVAAELGEDRCEGGVGDGLEVGEGSLGGVGLVGVVLCFVPAGGDDRGPDESGEQGGEGAAVGAGSTVGDVAGGAAQGVGGPAVGSNLRALGAAERLRRRTQLGPEVSWSLLGGGFDQIAEGGHVGLSVGVVAHASVEGVEGFSGLVPRSSGAVSAGCGVLLRCRSLQSCPEFGQSEVGGDFSTGVEDLFAVLVEVAGAAYGVAEKIS